MQTRTNVLLMADTHLGPGAAEHLTSKLAALLVEADVVLHAGDITDWSVIEAVRATAPHADVHAVAGNLDHGLGLPEHLVLDVDGCEVAMTHDGGPARGRAGRLRRRFPRAHLVVFGHSHLPWHEVDVRAADGHTQHHVNPGSAMLRRRSPSCSVARVVIAEARVADVRHVPLP